MEQLINRVQKQLDNNHAVEADDIQTLVSMAKDIDNLSNEVSSIDENQFTTPTDVKRRVLSLIDDIRYNQ